MEDNQLKHAPRDGSVITVIVPAQRRRVFWGEDLNKWVTVQPARPKESYRDDELESWEP